MNDVVLRKIEKSDLELLRNWRNNPKIGQYMFSHAYITKKDQVQWFEYINAQKNSYYWIAETEKQPIGFASLIPTQRASDSYSFGIYVGNATYMGGGYGKKILFHVIEYAFNKLNAHKVCCEVLAFNTKAIRLYETFGFRQEGYFKDYLKRDGERIDCLVFAIFDREWQLIKDSLYKQIYKN